MSDMLVKLYDLPDSVPIYKRCKDAGVEIRRAMTPDLRRIVKWVSEYSSGYAAGECESCFGKSPVSCFIATRGSEIVGYACYNPNRGFNSRHLQGFLKRLVKWKIRYLTLKMQMKLNMP